MSQNQKLLFEIQFSMNGTYEAKAEGADISVDGQSEDEIKEKIRQAVMEYFPKWEAPPLIHLRFIKEEIIFLNA